MLELGKFEALEILEFGNFGPGKGGILVPRKCLCFEIVEF